MTEERYHTLAEVAELLQVSERTVHRWIRSGSLPAFKPGGDWRIGESDLQTFLETRRASTAKKALALRPSAEAIPEQRRIEYDLILLAADSSRALKESLESLPADSPNDAAKTARKALTRALISMQAGFREHGLYERLRPYEGAMLSIEVSDDREDWVLVGGMPLEEADDLVIQTPVDVRRAILEIHTTRRELFEALREEISEWRSEEELIKESTAKVDQVLDQIPDMQVLVEKLESRERELKSR